MTRDDLKLYRLAKQVEDADAIAAGMLRGVACHEAVVVETQRKLAELSAGIAPDVWLQALGRELWAQAQLRRQADIDGLFVTGDGNVWARPKGSNAGYPPKEPG